MEKGGSKVRNSMMRLGKLFSETQIWISSKEEFISQH